MYYAPEMPNPRNTAWRSAQLSDSYLRPQAQCAVSIRATAQTGAGESGSPREEGHGPEGSFSTGQPAAWGESRRAVLDS